MRGIREEDQDVSDVWFGGRIPVGNIKFLEPTYDEESYIYISRYIVGITIFLAGSWQPIELTFGIPEARDLAGHLSDALKTKPKLREQWKAIGSVDYAICDWDDPTLDDNRGFVTVDSGRKVIRITIRTDPRNSGVNLGTNEVQFELKRVTVPEFVGLLEKATSSIELEEDTESRQLRPIAAEEPTQDGKGRPNEKYASGKLEFLEITSRRESEILGGYNSREDWTRLFIASGADCDLHFDSLKTNILVQFLKEAVRTARGASEDWKRIGFAPYTMCDWDDCPHDNVHGGVIIDARKGRIRLIIRADPRWSHMDWPIVAHTDFIEELIATLQVIPSRQEIWGHLDR